MTKFPPELDTPEFHAAWHQWALYRAKRKPKLTEFSIARQLKFLTGIGPERAIAAIEYSIMQGYQGVFEERKSGGKASSYQGLKGFAARAAEDGSMHKEFGDV